MSRRGWRGSPPLDDDDARRRIIEAAVRCVDRYGAAKTGLSDVAAELGITRQTVYRHFATTDDLFEAAARAGVDAFVDVLAEHLSAFDSPAEVVVEAIAYATERLPKERYLGLLLAPGHAETFWRGVTSPLALHLGRGMLTRTKVDWKACGFDDIDLDELVEVALRLLASLVTEPNQAHAEGQALRDFLHRWVAPAVAPKDRRDSTEGAR